MLVLYYLANWAYSFGEKIKNLNLVQVQIITSPITDYKENQSTVNQLSVKNKISYTRDELLDLKERHDNRRLPCLLPYNAIRTVRKLKLNKKKNRNITRTRLIEPRRGVNDRNLIHIAPCNDTDQIKLRHGLSISTINARSVKNKDHLLSDEFTRNNSDCIIITETWLGKDDDEWVKQSCLTSNGYGIERRDRGTRGGGIALLYKNQLSVTKQNDRVNDAYENGLWTIKTRNKEVTILAIYRPPTSSTGKSISEFV